MQKPRVLVAGDATIDVNIARSDGSSCATFQFGGAILLGELIRRLLPDANILAPEAGNLHESLENRTLPQAYSLWSLQRDGAWRVSESLPSSREPASSVPATPSSEETASVIALDDSGCGFREYGWAPSPRLLEANPWIVLKMASPVAQGSLFSWLSQRHVSRLIVVIGAEDLRLTEVHISRKLSWDRTALDLAWELTYNPQLQALSACAHVVVSFPTSGAFLSTRGGESPFQLLFDPNGTEGTWVEGKPGGVIGYTTCLTAALVRELATNAEPDLIKGTRAGLAAMRALHTAGFAAAGSAASGVELRFPHDLVASAVAAGSREFAHVSVPTPLKPTYSRSWTILSQCKTASFSETAARIAREGTRNALAGLPSVGIGQLTLLDRNEIESYGSVRALIEEYLKKGNPKPFSIAVFGPPGAGKSFGVKQLCKTLSVGVGDLVFNLSQFRSPDELVHAFHRVRDLGLAGKLPLVFWDEFDTRDQNGQAGWLRHFLAPMQDGEFQEGEIVHPIGRAIFVFAGSTARTMEEFALTVDPRGEAKGRDFISRLKGHIDVLGPNPQSAGGDEQYIIRRALLFRGILAREAPKIASQGSIDSGVLRALLHVSEYRHGARSMEAILAMSSLSGRSHFDRSCLPPASQMSQHVNALEFQALVQQVDFPQLTIEHLAQAVHEFFCKDREAEGFRYGPKTDEAEKTHCSLKPFAELPMDEQEQNRSQARDIQFKLASIGCQAALNRPGTIVTELTNEEVERLAKAEHDRWMALKHQAGWKHAEKTDKDNFLHEDLLPWDRLTEAAKNKDRLAIRRIPELLTMAGYVIVRV